MSDLRTAAQKALEAIRIFREWEMGQDYHSNRETILARAFAAEEKLEAALAEPPPEAQTEAEKVAYCAGWWDALEKKRK